MTTTKAVLLVILLSSSVPVQVMAIGQPRYIETTASRGRIPLVAAAWPRRSLSTLPIGRASVAQPRICRRISSA